MPGLILVIFYIGYVIAVARPAAGSFQVAADPMEKDKLLKLLGNLLPPVFLIILVLGSILTVLLPPRKPLVWVLLVH